MNNKENLNNNSICEKIEENRQARIGRISHLSCMLAEKALIDEYNTLPEYLLDNENNYLPEYQEYFNDNYDYYYNELMSYFK